jgi:hypothetical protein
MCEDIFFDLKNMILFNTKQYFLSLSLLVLG